MNDIPLSARIRLKRAIKKLPGLVGYWPLDETEGSTSKNIAPANLGSLDGTTSGATVGQPGKAGRAYSFDGVNDKVEISNLSSQISGDTTMTFFGIVNPVTVGTKGFFGFRNGDVDDSFYILALNDTTVEYRFRNSAGTDFTIGATVPSITNVWSIFALVLDGSNLTAYHNGVSVGTPVTTATGSIGSETRPLLIGEEGFGSNFVEASIQHIALLNTALTSSELLKLAKIAKLA